MPFQAGRTFAKTCMSLQEPPTDIKNRIAEACTSSWKLAAGFGSQRLYLPGETAVGCCRLYVNDLNVTFKS